MGFGEGVGIVVEGGVVRFLWDDDGDVFCDVDLLLVVVDVLRRVRIFMVVMGWKKF